MATKKLKTKKKKVKVQNEINNLPKIGQTVYLLSDFYVYSHNPITLKNKLSEIELGVSEPTYRFSTVRGIIHTEEGIYLGFGEGDTEELFDFTYPLDFITMNEDEVISKAISILRGRLNKLIKKEVL